jgi:hypothetical protein
VKELENIIPNSSLHPFLGPLLTSLQNVNLSGLLSLLFRRVGHECGQFKRHLDENRISWGYFIDHNLFEPHCNAHPNNFIVLDLERHLNLLAPLDFDMTYDFDTFVNIVPESEKYGQAGDLEMFDNWAGLEKFELEKALGGMENMANFAYGGQEVKGLERLVEIGLRDTCVRAYREAYDKIEVRAWEEWEKCRIDVNKLVQMALIVTDHYDT